MLAVSSLHYAGAGALRAIFPAFRQNVNLLATQVQNHAWLYAIAGVFAGVYLFYRGFRMLQRKRLIENTPSSRIRSASMGLVEVSGLANGPYSITAPLSGRACYLHRTIAWEWRREGKNSQWVKSADETLHVPFFLDDNTGSVLVDPQGAEIQIHRDFSAEFGPSMFSSTSEMPANVAGFLARHGVDCGRKIKVEEYCIKPKNALFILGTLAENQGLTASPVPMRTAASDPRQVKFPLSNFPLGLGGAFTVGVATGIQPVAAPMPAPSLNPAQRAKVTAALMQAGISNPAAWAAAGITGNATSSVSSPVPASSSFAPAGSAAAAAASAPEKAPEPHFDAHPPVVLMRGTHNPAFFISWQSQRDVVRALGWKSAAMIWGGPALTLVSVYLLAAQFGWL